MRDLGISHAILIVFMILFVGVFCIFAVKAEESNAEQIYRDNIQTKCGFSPSLHERMSVALMQISKCIDKKDLLIADLKSINNKEK